MKLNCFSAPKVRIIKNCPKDDYNLTPRRDLEKSFFIKIYFCTKLFCLFSSFHIKTEKYNISIEISENDKFCRCPQKFDLSLFSPSKLKKDKEKLPKI